MSSPQDNLSAVVILPIDQERIAGSLPLLGGKEEVYVRKPDEIKNLQSVKEVIFVISKFSTCSTHFQDLVLKMLSNYKNLIPMYTYFLDNVTIPEGISDLRTLPKINNKQHK